MNSMRHRIAWGVRTADVEQPGNGIGQGDHACPRPAQRICKPRDLVLIRFASQDQRLRQNAATRRAGLILPDLVDQVRRPFQRHAVKLVLQAAQGLDRMQPGIEADTPARGQGLVDPFREPDFGPVHRREDLCDLRFHLNTIPAVDEDPGPVAQGHTVPGRAGKSRQPGEPVIAGRHVFTLMRIRPRHDEPFELACGQRCAQGVQPAWPGIG
jgi:hypothetical protein